MNRITKIKLELSKLLAAFRDIKTDKAVLTYDGEYLVAGKEVYVADENGEYTPALDGEYLTEDGKVIVVKEGKVESITDPKAEVEAADPIVETDGVKETETDAIDAIHREINELYNIVDKLIKEVADLKGKSEATEKTVEKMSKISASLSAEEVIEDKATVVSSGNKKIDNFNKFFK